DIGGVVGMSSRGNWSHEAKMLLLLDGQEMNDLSFGNTEFGQHYDINQIEKIEIMRSPGSSLYGGFASLGVINIITKNGNALKGVNVTGTYGFLKDTYARRNASIAIGNNTGNVTYSLSGYFGQGRRSDQDYTDAQGDMVNLKDNTKIYPGMLNGALQIKDFSARFIYDSYAINSPWFYNAIQTPLEKHSNRGFYTEAKYEWKPTSELTIIPKLNFKSTTPWKSEPNSSIEYYEVLTSRLSPSVNLNYNLSAQLNFVAGIDAYFDHAERKHGFDPNFYNGTKDLSFYDIGLFGQVHFKNEYLPLFVGARMDRHSQFGTAFSPRIGITKVFDAWNFKALYSRSFRTPALENLNKNINLKPEYTNVAEVEIGYQLTNNMSIKANVYDIRITDPIVFSFNDEFPFGNFINENNTGTKGLELEYSYKSKFGFIAANYAYFSAKNRNYVTAYQVPEHDNNLLAWPAGKLNIYGSLNLSENMSLSPTITYLSSRYAFTQFDANGALILKKNPETVYFNLFFQNRNLLTKGLDVGVGINDISNQRQLFIQPYNSASAPLSGVGREILVRMSYTIPY
ncbi:MAG: TonB-dependent receptor, partial [Daejeonella sp.]